MKKIIAQFYIPDFFTMALVLEDATVVIAIMEAGKYITKEEFLTQAEQANFDKNFIEKRAALYDAIDGKNEVNNYLINSLL
jgi:hypothetical protein